MRTLFYILGPAIVILYLLAMWSDWFSQVILATVGRRPLFSEPINIQEASVVKWHIPKGALLHNRTPNGKAKLSLVVNTDLLKEIPTFSGQLELRVKVVTQGLSEQEIGTYRLIRDWYFTSDEPLSAQGRGFWIAYGRGRLEHGLAGVVLVPEEDLEIELHVKTPDAELPRANPRLKLVGDHDIAIFSPQNALIGLGRDGGFFVCCIVVLLLAAMAWRRPKVSPLVTVVPGKS
jgi:hypothetical protein